MLSSDILVLDDEENYAVMLNDLLCAHHFCVDTITKPVEALEALREKRYALIISDYNMPVMGGAEFLEHARKIDPSIPVIMISGHMNTPELVKVANIGVSVVLEKPFDTQNFINHVRKYAFPLIDEKKTNKRK